MPLLLSSIYPQNQSQLAAFHKLLALFDLSSRWSFDIFCIRPENIRNRTSLKSPTHADEPCVRVFSYWDD